MADHSTQAEIVIRECPWTDDLDSKMEKSARGDLAIIKDQVLKGIAQLWQCSYKDKGGYVVTRIDDNELVIVLGEGTGAKYFAPKFINYAKQNNMGFRTHVQRKGLIRLYSQWGLEIDEYVLRLP